MSVYWACFWTSVFLFVFGFIMVMVYSGMKTTKTTDFLSLVGFFTGTAGLFGVPIWGLILIWSSVEWSAR